MYAVVQKTLRYYFNVYRLIGRVYDRPTAVFPNVFLKTIFTGVPAARKKKKPNCDLEESLRNTGANAVRGGAVPRII